MPPGESCSSRAAVSAWWPTSAAGADGNPPRRNGRFSHRCKCPACRKHGVDGLQACKLHGFCCRATHNLWVILGENRWLTKHIARGTYLRRYKRRLNNSVYRPLIDELLALDAKR